MLALAGGLRGLAGGFYFDNSSRGTGWGSFHPGDREGQGSPGAGLSVTPSFLAYALPPSGRHHGDKVCRSQMKLNTPNSVVAQVITGPPGPLPQRRHTHCPGLATHLLCNPEASLSFSEPLGSSAVKREPTDCVPGLLCVSEPTESPSGRGAAVSSYRRGD